MLWRKGYDTEVVEGFESPEDRLADVVVGISGLEQVTDAELWMRLLDKDFPDLGWKILSVAVDLNQVLPPSRMARVVLGDQNWGLSREFCYCAPAKLLMVGPPTEDAWEQFSAAITEMH